MNIYQVIGWDPMASSHGAEYLDSTFASKDDAEARAQELNETARTRWMATCSPAGRANYRDEAHVRQVDVR